MPGIKETTEVIIAANLLTCFLIERLKDGVQMNDFSAAYEKLILDEGFKNAMRDAYKDIEKVPAEMGDLDGIEMVELSSLQINMIPKLLSAIKK